MKAAIFHCQCYQMQNCEGDCETMYSQRVSLLLQIILKADGIYLDVIDQTRPLHGSPPIGGLGRHRATLFQPIGRPSWHRCDDLNTVQPVTFVLESAVLALPPWVLATSGGDFEMRFRTTEQNGLLAYAASAKKDRRPFFALQITNGEFCIIFWLTRHS